ncbi:MAG TPA: hypothetical protein ENI68_10005 [Gammaproteobacteria bacterium]|nr:hypothetical protein [Gammaproteobacteria bacterium]
MASARKIAEAIIDEAGVPPSTINSISRRLAEDGIIPRGSRGHAVKNLSPMDCSNLLLGALALADSYGTVSNRIGRRVKEIGGLRFSGGLSAARDNKSAKLDCALEVFSSGETFAATIAGLMAKATTAKLRPRLPQIIRKIGVTLQGESVGGWIEFSKGLEISRGSDEKIDGCVTNHEATLRGERLTVMRGQKTAMARETYFEWDAIQRIAELGAKDNPDWSVR